jgi:ribosome maturation factor RimP
VKEQQIISAEVGNLGYSLVDIEREGRGLLRVTIEDRPVKTAVEFIRFAGLEIDLKLRVAISGRKNFRGVLQGLKSGSVDSPDARFSLLFEASDGSAAELEFSLAEVEKARLVPVIDFKGKKS